MTTANTHEPLSTVTTCYIQSGTGALAGLHGTVVFTVARSFASGPDTDSASTSGPYHGTLTWST